MENKMNRKGFTLIELVIVVVIIGILALMVLPQFGNVTHDAKLQTYKTNCQTAASALAMYQAGHNGAVPSNATYENDLNPYINGGWKSLSDNANKIAISYADGVITGTFTCGKGDTDDNHKWTYSANANS